MMKYKIWFRNGRSKDFHCQLQVTERPSCTMLWLTRWVLHTITTVAYVVEWTCCQDTKRLNSNANWNIIPQCVLLTFGVGRGWGWVPLYLSALLTKSVLPSKYSPTSHQFTDKSRFFKKVGWGVCTAPPPLAWDTPEGWCIANTQKVRSNILSKGP